MSDKITTCQQYKLFILGVPKEKYMQATRKQAAAMIGRAIERIKSDWVMRFKGANNEKQLQSIGSELNRIAKTDPNMTPIILNNLRKAYKQRQKELTQ
jgi:predicted nuclease of restriction endonuclease-like (RecB) superfamily